MAKEQVEQKKPKDMGLDDIADLGMGDIEPFGGEPEEDVGKAWIPPTKPDKKPEPTKSEEKPDWDKDRQRRDQDHANERKAILGQVEALTNQMQTLQSANQDLRGQLESVRTPKEVAEPEKVELSADSPWEDAVKVINQLHKTVAQLNKQNADLSAQVQDTSRAARSMSDEQAEKQMLDQLNGEFGAEFQNDATTSAVNYLAKAGYSKEKPPERMLTYQTLRNAYQHFHYQRKLKELGGKGKSAGTAPAITLDDGTGGAAASPFEESDIPSGSNEDVLKAMRVAGKL